MPKQTVDQLVDQLGDYEVELQLFNEIKKQAERIKAQLRVHVVAKGVDEDTSVTLTGTRYIVEATKPSARGIDSMAKLFTAVGKPKFLKLCSVSVKKLEDAVGKIQAQKYLAWGRSETWKLTVKPKPAE